MKRLARLILVAASLSLLRTACGQGLAPAPDANTKMSPYAAGREEMMAPAMAALNRKEYGSALAQFEAVLTQYPGDARVLMFTARTAHLLGDDKKAAGYYKTALQSEAPHHPQWPLHMEAVPVYAAAGDWEDFDQERLKIRDAVATAEAPIFKNFTWYAIEYIHQGDKTISVMEFPKLFGRFHSRYRFFLPVDPAVADWKPFIDCESDDVDQVEFAKNHPDLAARGERSFSLDSYPKPNTHGTMTFFSDGEPSYETVRALVLKNAPPMVTSTRP